MNRTTLRWLLGLGLLAIIGLVFRADWRSTQATWWLIDAGFTIHGLPPVSGSMTAWQAMDWPSTRA